MVARIFREAGARVRFNAFLRDMNRLAVDVTLRSALTRDGEPQPNAADEDGAVLVQARHDKVNTYLELVAQELCRLVVLAIET